MLRALELSVIPALVAWPVTDIQSTAETGSSLSCEEASPSERLEYRIYTTGDPHTTRRHRGDWEPSDALLVAYTGHWPEALAGLIDAASDEVSVFLLVDPMSTPPEEVAAWASEHGIDLDNINLIWTDLDSPWVRDYGPLQVVDAHGEPLWLDADYGASRPSDDVAPISVGDFVGVPVEKFEIDLDGGALISNGQGLCASTTDYFDMHRIPMEEDDFREWFLSRLGCSTLVLVPALAYEATHHIDMFGQFLSAETLALASFDAIESPADARRMAVAVQGFVDIAAELGIDLRLVRVPTPYSAETGYRTYLNDIRLASQFFVPSYSDVAPEIEEEALATLSRALRDIRVTQVPADEMIRLDGALHCMAVGLALPRVIGVVLSHATEAGGSGLGIAR